MESHKEYQCTQCHHYYPINKFFKKRNGQFYLLCKNCIYNNIDETNINDILLVLKELDIPFIYNAWEQYNNCPPHHLGRYISLMNLANYRGFRFIDSEELNKYEQS